MLVRWIWLLAYLSLCDGEGMFSVEAPRTPISSPLGGSVSLPCTLSPALNAETFEVLWHRPQEINTPVLSYKNRKIQEDPTDPRYRGRVSLSGALEKGDVSLKLENLTLADKGDYVCRVEKTEEWFDEATVSLQVKISGSPLVLSIADAGEGQVNVSCHSHGWLPEPSLSWTDGEGRDLKHLSKSKFIKDSEGLVKVSSWLLVSSSESEWLSCSVGFTKSDPERKECRVMPFTCPESWKGAFITVLILFILLLLCNVGMAVYAVLHRKGLIGSKKKKEEDTERAEEAHPLNPSVEQQQQNEDPTADPPHQSVFTGAHDHQIPESKVDGPPPTGAEEAHPLNPSVEKQQQNEDPTADPPHQSVSTVSTAEDVNQEPSKGPNSHTDPPPQAPPEWDQVKEFKEVLTIDPEETPRFFRVTHGGKRVTCTHPKEDDEAETQKIFTLCREKFSSGKHYWEVKIREKTKEKKSWYVGVASETAERMFRTPLTPVNGFWVLCYEEERGVYIRGDPVPVPLPHVGDELTTVGVFLDCDEHTLSFYNADTKSHLHTLTNLTLRAPLYPLISPGVRDKVPIWIL